MKTLVILSGGMDSTTLLHLHYHRGDKVRALSVHYGQRHSRELEYARQQANLLSVPHEVVDLSGLRRVLAGSALTSPAVAVPEGHYAEASMKATVVPNRNMILLAIAIGHALSTGCDSVTYGAHAGDHAIYPDCREEFAQAMSAAAGLCDWKKIEVLRPFVDMTKAQIVKLGVGLEVDYSKTWSCYSGGEIHCGRCGTCVERIQAFKEAGAVDPVPYADPLFAFTVFAPTT